MAVYTRNPAAYEALSSFHILQLPSAITLKTYIRSNIEAADEVELRLMDERKKYDARMSEHTKTNPPLCKGILLFDEVKVAAKLHWNSRTDELVGHSTSAEEMATLSDLYEKLDAETESRNTDYILQTLWHDLTSECDIVGPYYTNNGTFKAKKMLPCVMDSITKFHCHGFKVCAVICDGAATNLTMLKILLGTKGHFQNDPSLADQHYIKPYFTNPFTGKNIHIIICPSHQVCLL